jgi:small subunit ribosomal protein S8
MSDPIADMVVRIKNALRRGHTTVTLPTSRIKEDVCRILQKEGYINGYTVEGTPPHRILKIQLKYLPNREPVIRNLRRVSKPSLRVYSGYRDVRQVCSGLGVVIMSTSKGVMTNKQARRQRVGGEVLCEVW